ncbi:MAG: hypothetical protein ACRDKW_11855, partial [Actinomycetota bacterium]
MSGLLHRLASRAMGSASSIRPAVRLPFAPAPLPVEESAEVLGPADRGTTPPVSMRPAQPPAVDGPASSQQSL